MKFLTLAFLIITFPIRIAAALAVQCFVFVCTSGVIGWPSEIMQETVDDWLDLMLFTANRRQWREKHFPGVDDVMDKSPPGMPPCGSLPRSTVSIPMPPCKPPRIPCQHCGQ